MPTAQNPPSLPLSRIIDPGYVDWLADQSTVPPDYPERRLLHVWLRANGMTVRDLATVLGTDYRKTAKYPTKGCPSAVQAAIVRAMHGVADGEPVQTATVLCGDGCVYAAGYSGNRLTRTEYVRRDQAGFRAKQCGGKVVQAKRVPKWGTASPSAMWVVRIDDVDSEGSIDVEAVPDIVHDSDSDIAI